MKLNTASAKNIDRTYEGTPAVRLSPIARLRRSTCSAFLWEDEYYEDGEDIASRVCNLAKEVSLQELSDLAIELRTEGNLRHMPLLLTAALAKRGSGNPIVADTVDAVIRRADDMGELLAIHAKLNGVGPDRLKSVMPAQMKKGLARAFSKFDAYQLAKYNRNGAIRLRDIMFLTHPRPANDDQQKVWSDLLDGRLKAPDTWEVALSGGADKRESFTRLLKEGKLGYMALLRNLRGMMEAGVDDRLVRDAILARKGANKVLPFRFTAAARACPRFEAALDEALFHRILEMPVLEGRTIVLVDVSASMDQRLSDRSDLTRMDAAATLASVINGDLRVFSFSKEVIEVPARRGMAGVDVICNSQIHYSTYLGKAVQKMNALPHDRLIVITDEQSNDAVPAPVVDKAYMINVASCRNAIGFGDWIRINGFSENVLQYIHEHEKLTAME